MNLTELAHEELESWELSAMRDPRNWVRPAAAAVVTALAGTALVSCGSAVASAPARSSPDTLRELAERTLTDIAEEARRILPDR